MNVCVAHLEVNVCVAKNFGAWTEKVGHPCFTPILFMCHGIGGGKGNKVLTPFAWEDIQ